MEAGAAHEAEGPCRTLALGKRHTCGLVAAPFELEVKEHHEATGALVPQHFRAFHNTAALDIAAGIGTGAQCQTAIRPMAQVGRRINSNTAVHGVAAVGALFAIPIIVAVVLDDAASVSIDVAPGHIGPWLTVDEGAVLRESSRYDDCQQAGQSDGSAASVVSCVHCGG